LTSNSQLAREYSKSAASLSHLRQKNGTLYFALKVSNPFSLGTNNANRVENEVASLYLARKGLADKLPEYSEIAPAVYDWQSLSVKNPAPGDE
jgi:hypothetical protein